MSETSELESKSKIWMVALAGGVVLCIGLFTLFTYAKTAEDRTLPGLFVGNISVGNMTKTELQEFLGTMSNKLSTDGIEVRLKHVGGLHSFSLLPEVVGGADVVDYISLDTTAETDRIFALGKTGNFFTNTIAFYHSKLNNQNISLENLVIDTERIKNAIAQEAQKYEKPPEDAKIVFTDFSPLRYSLTSSTPGFVYPIQKSLSEIEQAAKNFEHPVVMLEAAPTEPTVTPADWQAVLSTVSTSLSYGPLTLVYMDEAGDIQKQWNIPVATFASWLTVKGMAPQALLHLDFASTTEYLENKVDSAIRQESEDAKFTVDADGKVKEFQASRVGIGLDIQKTYEAIEASFQERITNATSTPVKALLTEIKPNIATGQVNDLGIKEILGVGISNFSGSPSNRIKNIRNAVNKLNGLLIKPGDEFSAIKYTQPYTLEGGYLPEKVIKGDELKAEIGGGLCQVGTTLFRMAMNSGLEITERRNHSLVVSYYNDLSNGLPGTDATIYEPSPDFRFKNDTNNYILIQTAMNDKTGELKFTVWGTDDGREGSYTKPMVHKWIPAGAPRITETTSLAPGEKQCQNAFRGAQTSFTYTRVMPDGSKQETVFDSYYRPLPQICLVGVDKSSTSCPEGEVCAPPGADGGDESAVEVEPVHNTASST